MNLRQEMTRVMQEIESKSLPASENARYIRKVLNNPEINDCPHDTGSGCSIIDVCDNSPCREPTI